MISLMPEILCRAMGEGRGSRDASQRTRGAREEREGGRGVMQWLPFRFSRGS